MSLISGEILEAAMNGQQWVKPSVRFHIFSAGGMDLMIIDDIFLSDADVFYRAMGVDKIVDGMGRIGRLPRCTR